jgi:polyphenol oxidase
MEWREQDGLRWLEAELPGARAAFSTRSGGVSEAPFETLNLGILTGDDPAAVLENRTRLATALGLQPNRVLMGLQVHGFEVLAHRARQEPSPFASPGSPLPEVDGNATSLPGLAPLVLVADCLPVALAGPGGVAMLHCGWRGLAGEIAARGAETVAAESAAIGPGIGPCCYRVGPEVRARFEGLGKGVAEGPMLDLAEVVRRQLRAAGVKRIESTGLCTSCEPQLFFSHRRDGERSGRQGGLVWLGGCSEGGS